MGRGDQDKTQPPRAPGGRRPRRPAPSAPAPETPPEDLGSRTDDRAVRISLPPSGLADDILALAEGAGALTPPDESAEPPAAAQPAAPRSHNISFFAPAREEPKAAEATEHLVTFLLGSEEYGVDVRLVQEIIRVGEITPVPRAPGFIKGVINLRGRIIPVIDLKARLKLGEVAAGRQSRVVVVKLRERLIGLLVDAASHVLRVPLSSVDPAPDEVMEVEAAAIRGVAKLEARLIILLDLPRALASELREAEARGALESEGAKG